MPLLLVLLLSVVPQGVILIKGATPSASDASTPLPEQGRVSAGRYRNAYFGLSYPIPAGWSEQPAGPPPSDGGGYVLGLFAMEKANVLITAQDLFFDVHRTGSARELVASMRAGLLPRYEVEGGPQEVTIAGRTFHRLAYASRASGMRWRILATDARCHALAFTFTGTDSATLDAAERAMSGLSLSSAAPACVHDYANGNVVAQAQPQFTGHRYNTIPVRVIVGKDGAVKHVHVLSAFPEQSQAILAALRTWRFKPYREGGRAAAVETGLVFGMPPASAQLMR
jgi:hypothetical protein